jgi:Holliday junction resolvase RusA-like endonuclease
MKGYKIVLNLRPYPSPRPRATARGGFASVYMPKEYMTYKADVQKLLPKLLLTGAIMIDFTFCFEMPKSWSKKKKSEMMDKHHTQKPDWDNLCKTYMDAMNNIVYTDDGQSSCGRVKKVWSDKNEVIIKVIEMDG